MTKLFRLIIDPPRSAARNMAVDEMLLLSRSEKGVPVLRFYEWSGKLRNDITSSTLTDSEKKKSYTNIPNPKLRPWLQAFDLGAVYTPTMVKAQVSAEYDAASSTPEFLNGFMMWNARGEYQKAFFDIE